MKDDRFSFLAESVSSVTQDKDLNSILDKLEVSRDAQDFLDDSSIPALKVIANENGIVEITTNFKDVESRYKNGNSGVEVMFVRRTFESITPNNIASSIDVHTINGPPLDNLYNTLKGVWCPTLLQNQEWADVMPPRVQQLLAELESALGSSVRSVEPPNRGGVDLGNVSSISNPMDEIDFWIRLKEDRRSPLRELAKGVDDALSDISNPGFSSLESLPMEELPDLMARTLDALNGVWLSVADDGTRYPQSRMQHFMDVIGNSICKVIQHKHLANLDPWTSRSGEVRSKLQAAIQAVEAWVDVPRKLTTTFWPGCEHPWRGDVHEDSFATSYKARLEQVLSIRTLSDELSQLLSAEERDTFRVEDLFLPLSETKPLVYNPYTESQWEAAVAKYEKGIDPVESAVAEHLRRNMAPLLDRPQLLLREFQTYQALLERGSIRRSLISEREALLSLLRDSLHQMEEGVDRVEAGEDTKAGRLLGSKVAGVVIIRQIGAKAAAMLSTSQQLLNDIDGYAKFAQESESLIQRIRAEEDSRFRSWREDIDDRIDQDDPQMRLSGSLMGWSDGVLVVNFSEDLVRFLREVRQLDELGFDIPRGSSRRKGILEAAIDAERFYRYGMLLKKTANFYNSISEQIIDVQEQLLLGSLNAFVSIVSKTGSRSDGDINWTNPAECENYVRGLQDAAEKLSSENRWLRKVHESLCSQATVLMGIDLLRQPDLWKSRWRAIKEKLESVKQRYNEKDRKLWVLHWDHQMYKVIEVSYQMGLESLNENLSEIKAELVFSNKRLDFKPPLEQIRQTYYHEMRKFAGIPANFEGFGNKQVYRQMGTRNSKRLAQVFVKAESLFDRLQTILQRYEPLVLLGQVDLDAYVEEYVKSPDDYITNFKSLRARRKDIDKLPDVEKEGCVTISLVPLKNYLEELYQNINDTLLIILRRTLLEEFKEVDSFLETSNEKLNTRPHTVDEIGESGAQWKEIDQAKDRMRGLSKRCTDKKKLLMQFAPGTSVDISEVLSRMSNLDGEGGRWDDFDISLEAFNDMIEEQKIALKSTLEEEVVTLNVNIDKFGSRWKQLKPTDVKTWEKSEIERVFTALEDWQNQFNQLQEQAEILSRNCVTFAMPKPRFDGLDDLLDDFGSTSQSWDMLKEFYKELDAMADQDWLTFSTNVYVLLDFAQKWLDNLKEKLAQGTFDAVTEHIVTYSERMKKSTPALKYCRGEPFKEDHWTELLQGKLKMKSDVRRENVKVQHFLDKLDILMEPSTLSFVKNLQARALGEVQIREALQELRAWERSAEISLLSPDESGRRICLIKDWKDLFLEMGDKQSLLSSLKESQFFKAFEDQGLALEAKMSILDVVLHTLNSIQRKWVYLEPIFGRGALPSEEARFKRVDEDFTDIMQSVDREPKLFYLADAQIFPGLPDRLKVMLDQLERCQKALADFLEAKRSSMPRFYFIGDDDLLEILGQAKKPEVIQSHLKKLFQGIHKVEFNKDCTAITAMVSSAGEIVELETPVKVNEKVEDWLDLLAQEMRATLAMLLDRCLKDKTFDWAYPSQILCLAQQIKFTSQCERAIGGDLGSLRDSLTDTLHQLTSTDFTDEPLYSLKMKSLVLDIVHQIDVVDQLQRARCRAPEEWSWKKQLRYYFVKGMAVVRMGDAEFAYTYEYQGNAPKLVHTPLTDKCYLTLTQGIHMGFGGNPYGPAGTGKTESVKALSSCMGRQVLVFNCDEGIDYESMGRIFIGLVKCGAWGCFDEFNRLKEDQLSAISQQIQVIQDSIKARISPIELLGRSVDVDFNAGIFVTLNPAGKHYGGRSKLPDNLKALFRPVAMGRPDNELIAEVNLVTEGFTQSKDLASKIVSLFKLSKQLLSHQRHYDWGLRALKAVLNSGGRLIQSYKQEGQEVTSVVEYEILIKAVRVNTLSKLTYNDTRKFLALIGDVFPGIESTDITGGELEAAIKEVMKEKPFFLVEDASQIKKMIQLKESLDQRMGCVVVGPSGCGKSVLWRILKAAMMKCGQRVVTHVMNPKSMPRERLLGKMDLDTREWFDGVLTDAARKVVKEAPDVRCWIVCDGDVDPEWIESLNSVLDDNHLLTLPNGERISFGNNVNFLFETHDLRFASPATVSRMGMIFLSDEDSDVDRLIQRWLSSFSGDKQMSLSSWIDELFHKALSYVLETESVVDTTLVGTVMNGLSQIKDASSRQEFICGLIRGLGGNLSISARVQFAKEVFQWATERPPDLGQPLDCYGDGGSFVSFTPSESGAPGRSSLNVNELGDSAVVQTISVQRVLKQMQPWIENMEPFLLVGPEGCGKSMVINHAFRQKRSVGVATINCNAQTTADDVINKISQTCSLFSAPEGRVYRPRDCERLVLYLKDINLPRPDMYNTCQLIAFLQQLVTFDGFYDENLEFLRLERIQIVASMNAATTVGRHQLSTRFTAVIRIGVMDYPENSELVSVYDNFLNTVLSSIELKDGNFRQPTERERLSNALVEIYQKTREKFSVDDQRHYLFTPRDLTLWVKNLCRYDLEEEDLLNAVAEEANRIFRDRLVGSDAMGRFDSQLGSVLRSQFRYTPLGGPGSEPVIFTSLTSSRSGGGGEGKEGDEGNVTATFGGTIKRVLLSEFEKIIAQGRVYYEREERELDILLFNETLEHIAHVDRTLSSFSGHLLMVGRTGVGRRNAVTLAAYMLGYEIFTPQVSRGYNAKQFGADIKAVIQNAGIKGEHTVLIVEDFQVTEEAILEIINSLISAGEVPGLYTHEELEPLLGSLRERAREEGTARTPYDFFVAQVRKYLHVVLLMDPDHPKFLYRCESNPALYALCTVLWIGEWRHQSMRQIPMLMDGIRDLVSGKSILEDDRNRAEGKEEGKGESKGESKGETKGQGGDGLEDSYNFEESKGRDESEKITDLILGIHSSCAGASPRDFLSFLSAWYCIYGEQKEKVLQELGHLEAGLNKLDSATEVVNDLRTNAAQQAIDLKQAQAAADRAMDEISKALGDATERRVEVNEVKKTVAENEASTQERKNEIEGELAEVQPILDSAKEAVGQIKSDNLNEIRSLQAPPEAIADVLAAVLMMLGVQDLSWLSMKKFLGNRGVKDEILNFDAKRISNDLRKQVSKLIQKKKASFDAANIQRVSVAAAPLAAWVKANIRYSLVVEKIEPLQEELQEQMYKLEVSQKRLQSCEEELQEIDDRVAGLKEEFASRTAEAERLKRNLSIAGETLDKAEGLIGQLGGEQDRWRSQVTQLRADLAELPMRMLLCAGFCTYLAKEPEDVRSEMIARWSKLSGDGSSSGDKDTSYDSKDVEAITAAASSVFSFKRTLTTESKLLQWKSLGLPADDLSQENGLVIQTAMKRVPFIIDPANAATDWLKSVLSEDKNRPLEVITHHSNRFTNQVELAVRFGKTLVILEVDGVEPMIYPLCRRDLRHQGPRYVVSVGDKTVDYNENFQLFLITRNPLPELPPDAAGLVTQVNFSVTRSGLEGQLLGRAIQHEQPELERAKGEMLRKEEDFKVQLASLERDLLEALATAEGNLLENTALIESLTLTKEKSAEIGDALVQSAQASVKLDEQREVYRPFAHAGASIFFLVKQLQSVNHMYQFSLASFLGLFKQSLEVNMEARDIEERLERLRADLEVRVLYFIGRALFKLDRPMFALHLVRGMHPDHFQPREWEIFTGSLVASVSDSVPRGFPQWASTDRQSAFRLVSENLPHLINSLELDNVPKWQRFSTSLEAERDLPSLRGVSTFQKVLVIQMFRPDRLQSAILQFCCDLLRIESVSPPPLSLQNLFEESQPSTPLLLISSPGADASKELQEFAIKTIGAGQYEELAMGGGQQSVAATMLRAASNNGTWLCLKNLHLVVAWLPTLEKMLSSLEPHDDFRLWLTSEPHQLTPAILLQQSIKATFESPPGIKKNLQRTFEGWDESMFNPNEPIRARMLFLLACFHAVLQERRTYLPQGWTKFYEFSYGDLKAGTYVLETLAQRGDRDGTVDWEAVYGLMEDAIYGGRIDNVHDMRVLRAYLESFFCQRVVGDSGAGKDILEGTPLRMPGSVSYDSFRKMINQLPDSDAPYIFGLPDNIERSTQRATSTAVIKQLRALSTASDEASKYDRERWRHQLNPVLELWQSLLSTSPGILPKGNAPRSDKQNTNTPPVDDFVGMEHDFSGDICVQVDNALHALKKVLFGSGLLTPAIQATATSLLADAVPTAWSKLWEGPEKPQIWLRELIRKRMALSKWKSYSTKGNLLEEALVLGDVFSPSTFINALRQQTARLLNTAIDQVKMICSWDRSAHQIVSKVSPLPCTLTGLLLQGAEFTGKLNESPPEASEMSMAPEVVIGFVTKDVPDVYNEGAAVAIPLYTSTTREELLSELMMPLDDDPTRWVLSGVALFLSEE